MLNFQEIMKFKTCLSSMSPYYMVVTAWIKDSYSHRDGNAIDLAPRNGQGYARKLQGIDPNYNASSEFISNMKDLMPALHKLFPKLKQFIIEDDHIHVLFDDEPTPFVEFGVYATPERKVLYNGKGVFPQQRLISTILINSDGEIVKQDDKKFFH
jgi:hypothetical protein